EPGGGLHIGCQFRVGDGDFPYGLVQPGMAALFCPIHGGIHWPPNHDSPQRVIAECSRLNESLSLQLPWVGDIGGKKQVKGRSILKLREKISAGAVAYVYFCSCLFFEVLA